MLTQSLANFLYVMNMGKMLLATLLCLLPSIQADTVITIKNNPIQPQNTRSPQYQMVHMKGELNKDTFSLFKNLNGLEIERCAIHDLYPDAFKHTPLEILDVHDNIEFPTITSGTFQHLKKLKVFRFTFNPYTDIEEGAFVHLENLDVLVISHQDLKNVTKTFLAGLERLRELSLTFNGIQSVDRDAFEHMKDLTAVYLGHNSIKTIAPGTFKNQRKLEDLQLQDNRLGNEDNYYYVDWRGFDRIPTLRSLNIAGNHFRYINVQDLMTAFPTLESVNFLPNNLTCSSELYITKTLRHYKIQIEYYGNDHSNCKNFDSVRILAEVLDY
ncbi:leucine-rich repeat-containing protein 15-like [Coccinella septempunctata]|uniref:leucine-rich repeat-containing protein 15-like n=1 Tax=Coccinella septempunctata TaxID=41139 RepID=UPI001D090149|nr:leucine-rich repeat-containing protein 15-like [Coccinella septempunctata]